MMYQVKVFVTLKESIIDPAGTAVKTALHELGFENVQNVRLSKMIELTVTDVSGIEDMCERLLVNPVMETYHIEIEEIA